MSVPCPHTCAGTHPHPTLTQRERGLWGPRPAARGSARAVPLWLRTCLLPLYRSSFGSEPGFHVILGKWFGLVYGRGRKVLKIVSKAANPPVSSVLSSHSSSEPFSTVRFLISGV